MKQRISELLERSVFFISKRYTVELVFLPYDELYAALFPCFFLEFLQEATILARCFLCSRWAVP